MKVAWVLAAAAWFIAWSPMATARTSDPDSQNTAQSTAAEIDRLLAEEVFSDLPAGVSLAPRTDDQLFLRRVYLDLVGRLPSPNEITAFVLDGARDKRSALIDRLLADRDFGANWAHYWRDVIFYRCTAEQLLALIGDSLDVFLTEQFNANTGWDQIVRQLVTAKGRVREHGETALYVAHFSEPVDVAAETSRIFLGIQIQCAQCHDHPFDRWKREQFHELVAFFPRAGLRRGRNPGMPDLEIDSADFGPLTRRPGMLNGGALEHFMPDLKDPTNQGKQMTPVFFATGKRLESGATDDQRRQALADWMTAKENAWFARAFVNRIWAELVGEGFYEPVDDLGPERHASAQRTADYLAGQFADHGYDVKWLFRAVMATAAYQRESRPRRLPTQPPFTANVPQRLRADQLVDVLVRALGQSLAVGGRSGGRGQLGRLFGYDPSVRRGELASSIPQALMLMNSPLFNQSINADRRDTLLGQLLMATSDNEQIVTELYLRCVAREPSDDELNVCLKHLQATGNRPRALEDVLWSLVNSEEIRYRN